MCQGKSISFLCSNADITTLRATVPIPGPDQNLFDTSAKFANVE